MDRAHLIILPLATLAGMMISSGQEAPVYRTGADVPVAHEAGNVADALIRCRKLYEALKQNGWKDGYSVGDKKIPYEMLTLPDQKYAENEMLRTSTAFYIPSEKVPEYHQMAFYTEIYARKNTAYYKGDRSKSSPSGFYIVAWKDGRIEKVAQEDVRLAPFKSHYNRLSPVFPGMSIFREDLPKLPHVQNKDGSYPKMAIPKDFQGG